MCASKFKQKHTNYVFVEIFWEHIRNNVNLVEIVRKYNMNASEIMRDMCFSAKSHEHAQIWVKL